MERAGHGQGVRDAAEPVVVALVDPVGEREELLEGRGGEGAGGQAEFGQRIGEMGGSERLRVRVGAKLRRHKEAGDLFGLYRAGPADDMAAQAMGGERIPNGGLATGVERGRREEAVAIGMDTRGHGRPNRERERRVGRNWPAQGALTDQAPQVRELSAIKERTK